MYRWIRNEHGRICVKRSLMWYETESTRGTYRKLLPGETAFSPLLLHIISRAVYELLCYWFSVRWSIIVLYDVCRGVVQLFNAVKKHQNTVDERIKEVGGSERKKSKILSSVTKKDFIDVLRGADVAHKAAFKKEKVVRWLFCLSSSHNSTLSQKWLDLIVLLLTRITVVIITLLQI